MQGTRVQFPAPIGWLTTPVPGDPMPFPHLASTSHARVVHTHMYKNIHIKEK